MGAKVRDALNKHYAYIDQAGASGADIHIEESLQGLLGDKDYSPVVLFAINTII